MKTTITLGAKLNSGYPSGDNYPVTSSLRPDSGGTELSGDTNLVSPDSSVPPLSGLSELVTG